MPPVQPCRTNIHDDSSGSTHGPAIAPPAPPHRVREIGRGAGIPRPMATGGRTGRYRAGAPAPPASPGSRSAPRLHPPGGLFTAQCARVKYLMVAWDDRMFVSEPITPEPGCFDTALMRHGLASVPGAFTWRGRRYVVCEVLSHVKVSSGSAAGGQSYLRRQEFIVRLDCGSYARLYVERQARRGASRSTGRARSSMTDDASPGRSGGGSGGSSGGSGGAGGRQRWYLYTLADDPADL